MGLARLESVDLRNQWKDEAKDFTPWLAESENIELLGESIGMDLEIIAREERVGSFSADILCKDMATNKHVVIENQLEQTDHSHLGQVITYCAGLQAYTFIWIASQIREEHRAAVDWLNTITDDNYNFFAIEVQLFKIGESPVAPNFKIVAKPNGWSKSIKKQVDEDLNDNDKLRFEYWQAYREYVLSQCKTPFRPQKPQPQNWTNIAIGSSGVHINVLIGRKRSEIAVQLILDSDNAKCNFDKLYNMNFERSKSELSDNIEWARMDDKKSSIITVAIIGDYHNRDDWNRQFEWLYKMSVKFYMFFAPLVKNMK